jgi:hypothetical protein
VSTEKRWNTADHAMASTAEDPSAAELLQRGRRVKALTVDRD